MTYTAGATENIGEVGGVAVGGAAVPADAFTPGAVMPVSALDMLWSGTDWNRARNAFLGDGTNGLGAAAEALFLFNGTGWDRGRTCTAVLNEGSAGRNLAVAGGSFPRASLSAATGVGVGVQMDGITVRTSHTLVVQGSGVGISVALEGSMDNGTTWFPLVVTAASQGAGAVVGGAATGNGVFQVTGVPIRAVRANLTAIASGAVTAYVASA